MMISDIYREKSPLSEKDCFVVFDRTKSSFTFPVHVHPEYELNFVEGAAGAMRIVGDSIETIGNKDLVFIANPELKHAWKDGEGMATDIHEITLQFHPSLIEQCLDKKQFQSIQELFRKAAKGVIFGRETTERVLPLLRIITMEKDGFYSVMKLFILLYELSKGEDVRALSSASSPEMTTNEIMVNKLHGYISGNVSRMICVSDAAAALNMSRSTFARFIKSNTQMNFSDYLLDFRIKMAMQKLKKSTPIAEVVSHCGFNSISYFYRVFKKAKGITPAEFRDSHKQQQQLII
ncbi:AraC family transcriptional regulator [Pedobacter sp. PACM 27299]|uniref:AraC family transcriptional regulator n=1 Tax=Pedobacter sp. PACM 27299 TaxID=1727164 RepID=UPI001E566E76|nr:AraC family transcriptional regulator [Pedobacter sp. PACM 27299]